MLAHYVVRGGGFTSNRYYRSNSYYICYVSWSVRMKKKEIQLDTEYI